jgi:hypothetical protein
MDLLEEQKITALKIVKLLMVVPFQNMSLRGFGWEPVFLR